MRLKDKVAIVTGATAGMGRAAAELFAREGARVVMCGRREELGQEIVKLIKGRGGEATFVTADVARAEDVKRVVDTAVSTYGRLDVLFNNAGINEHSEGDPDKEPVEIWDRIIDVNLKGTFLGMKYAIPEMRKAGGGSIINNSSVNDSQADMVSMSSYHASKGGVTALTKKAAVEYASDCIRVNAVNPGPIATEMVDIPWDKLTDPRHRRRAEDQTAPEPDGSPHGRGLRGPLLRLRGIGICYGRDITDRWWAVGSLSGPRLASCNHRRRT